jgi:hypothetical protein
VFTLLESIFKEFDTMANKRKVFKVRGLVARALAVVGISLYALLIVFPLVRSRRLEIATSQWRGFPIRGRTMLWSWLDLPTIA